MKRRQARSPRYFSGFEQPGRVGYDDERCSRVGQDEVGDTLRVYDLSNGKELWNFAYADPGKVEFPGSRSTPTVDGDRVYTVGMVGDLYCFSTTTQKPVWHKNIWTDFGGGSGVPASPFAPPQRAANCRYGESFRAR